MNKIYNTLTRGSSTWMFDVILEGNIITIKFDRGTIAIIEQNNKNILAFDRLRVNHKAVNSRMGPNALMEVIMMLAPTWFVYAKEKPKGIIAYWKNVLNDRDKILSRHNPATWRIIRHYPFVTDNRFINISTPPIESEADYAAYLSVVDALFAALPLPIADEVYMHVEAKAPYNNYHPHREPYGESITRKFFEEFELTQKIAAERYPLVASLFTVVSHGGEIYILGSRLTARDTEAYLARKKEEFDAHK